ncbi:MAG: VOC family protein [Gemmatimonadetes bacterium]|nr:VOC family protein [Gemmatimonadota bacterium]
MPRLHPALLVIPLLSLASCQAPSSGAAMTDAHARALGGIGSFGELVNSGVKTLALSAVLPAAEMDRLFPEAERVAERNKVQLYRESDLLVTDLFPADVATGKDVLLIYQGSTKDAYLRLKADADSLRKAGLYEGKAREAIARRFGRMLSYPTWRINELLAEQGEFRTLRDFGIRASNLFLYYRDLDRATEFYRGTLGMELVADYDMARIFRMTEDSYLILVDATKGMHTADEPKSIAVALVTDQLEQWHAYLATKGIAPKSTFAPKPGRAHDGFVIEDPEGYLLEFERFNQHPENEHLVPQLAQTKVLRGPASTVPDGLGFNATVTWLYYRDMQAMQTFYEEVMGLKLVVDQGWAKVYRGSRTGYVGLVDERRGMNRWSEKKAVNVSFIIDDIDGWFNYVKAHDTFPLRGTSVNDDEAGRYRAFVGYDPEGYYMEFDLFREHPLNAKLMRYLGTAAK